MTLPIRSPSHMAEARLIYAELKAERDALQARIDKAMAILDERVDLGDEEGWSEIAEGWFNDVEKALKGESDE